MRVFLSYAREQERDAARVNAFLKQDGHTTFFDRDQLTAGDEYARVIHEQIAGSDLFVFLMSPESLEKGSYARHELEVAEALWPSGSGRVLPVVVAPLVGVDLPAYLGSVTFFEPAGDVAASVRWRVSESSRHGTPSWLRYLFRGRALAVSIGVMLLLAVPFLGDLVLHFGPVWPEEEWTRVLAGVLGVCLGFLGAVALSRIRSGSVRTLVVLLAGLAFAYVTTAYWLGTSRYVETIGEVRMLVLPLEEGCAHEAVRQEILSMVDPLDPGFETPEAALFEFRASRGWDPHLVWTDACITAHRIRALGLWHLWHLLLSFLIWCTVSRPPHRPPPTSLAAT